MSASSHEPLIEAEVTPPSPRSTGIVFAVVCAVAAVLLHRHLVPAAAALAGAVAFLVLALKAPHRLDRLNHAWFRFGLLLNRIVSPVVMLLLYAGAIVPFGLVMQRLRDPLRLKRRPEAQTYWVDRSATPAPGSMTQQF